MNMSMNNLITTESDFVQEILKAEQSRLIDLNYLEQLKLPYLIRAAFYLRVSTIAQAKSDKTSLHEQELQIKEMITRNNWVLSGRYCDGGLSGKSMDSRKDFLRLVEDAKQGMFDVIVGWATDRLARNVDEMTALRAELRKCNVQITTVNEPTEVIDPRHFSLQANDDWKKLMAYIQDFNAQIDNAKIAARFKSGKMGKARNGKIPVKVPYGYRKIVNFENNNPKNKVEEDIIVESEAFLVQEIFDLYDKKSWGMKRIAEYLSLKKIPAPRGGKWCYSTIKYTLQNPTYTGLVRFGWRLSKSKESRARLQQGHEGIITKGQHKRIIQPDQYKRVQEKMILRKRLGGKAVSSKGLLTGILKCGRCGGGTYITSFPNWFAYKKTPEERKAHKESQVYLCSKYAAYGRSGCSKRYVIYAERIHKIVIDKITKLANSEEARQQFVKQMKKNNMNELKIKLDGLNKRFAGFEDKYKRLKQAYINGLSQLDEYTQDKQILDGQKNQLVEEIESAKIALLKEERVAQQSEHALSALADFEKSWAIADFTDRKALLQMLLEKIVVKENSVQVSFRQDHV